MDAADLTKRFTYHPPKGPEQQNKYHRLRQIAFEFAEYINWSQPDSREKSLAITALEEAVMWANAGIARNS